MLSHFGNEMRKGKLCREIRRYKSKKAAFEAVKKYSNDMFVDKTFCPPWGRRPREKYET